MNSHLTVLETAILPLNYSPKAIALPIELTRHTSKKASRKPVCLPLAPFGIYHTTLRYGLGCLFLYRSKGFTPNTVIPFQGMPSVVIVEIAYYHIYLDASNHYAPEPSVVFPTVVIQDSSISYEAGHRLF